MMSSASAPGAAAAAGPAIAAPEATRTTRRARLRAAVAALVAAVAMACAAAAVAPPAQADLLSSFSASSSSTQAGAYADATTSFDVTDLINDPVDTLRFHLPKGLLGTISNFTPCTMAQFYETACPQETQVGAATVRLNAGSVESPLIVPLPGTVYVLPSRRGEVAQLGISVYTIAKVLLHINVRPDDYGLDATVQGLQNIVSGTDLTLWGVPWDHWSAATQAKNERLPFMANPATCGEEAVTTVEVNGYLNPGAWETYSATSPAQTGCDAQRFEPEISVRADSPFTSRPSSLEFRIDVPQNTDPDGLQTPPLRTVTAVLPEGLTINPAVADGLQACSDAAFGQGSQARSKCPASSRVGSAEFEVPSLQDPHVAGAIYIGQPLPGDTYRLFVDAYGSSVRVKLVGSVRPDPRTGRLTAVFDDNPQAPVSSVTLTFRGGPRAALAMPDTCGVKPVAAVIDSWGGQTARPSTSFDVGFDAQGGACPPPSFTPSFAAGVVNPVAGASSPFMMRFGRGDGQRELGAVNGSLPPGLLGVLASVPLCGAAQGAAGTCPAASRIGHVRVAAGAGSHPLWLPEPGKPEAAVYLTEPYRKGDVAGMSIVVPAVAGPFDLGTVVTKVYLKLRPDDQGIDLQSERLPRILDGVPVRIREVVVTVDRKGFMVNPTNCGPMAVYANVFAQSWAKAPVSSRFQVGGCASLPMSPIIAAKAGGKGDVKRYQHPALEVSIRQPAGQAHLSRANVVLPKALNIDLKAPALKAACPRDVYAKDQCSPVATVGTVKAVTPLLRKPLTGPAFLIQKKGQLPDLVMRLRNDRMSLDLIGVLDFLRDGRLITRVKGIPDAALSSFVLQIKGGKDGSLLNRSALCPRHRLVKTTFQGQNGKLARKTPLLHVVGCGKARATAKAGARRSSRAAARRASARASAAGVAHAGARAAAAGDERAVGGRS